MVRNQFTKLLWLIIIGLIATISGTGQAFAAAENNQKYGSWLMHCSDVTDTKMASSTSTEEPSKQVCALFQSVAAKNRPSFGITVMILKDDGKTVPKATDAPKAAGLIKILVPLGILLPTGVGMEIDGQNLGLTGFLRCAPNGCTASATLSETLLEKMKTAKKAAFTVFLTPEDGLSIPVSLDGLAKGYDAIVK